MYGKIGKSDDMKYKLFVFDVDGTMTDGGIYYDERGNEQKKFCTRDAAGFFAARTAGIKIMVLTGRECAATSKRMQELKVDYLYQNVKNKVSFLRAFMEEHNIVKDEVGYIGDDLNDIPAMDLCGFVGCPNDSCTEVIEKADYVSKVNGGYGAVRDVVEHLLRAEGVWATLVNEVYGIGV